MERGDEARAPGGEARAPGGEAEGSSEARRSARVAVDAMRGDAGPDAALAAVSAVAAEAPDLAFTHFGDPAWVDAAQSAPVVASGRATLERCDAVVDMADRPRQALRRGRDSSMSRALEAVADGAADAAVSAGNTAALMTLASLRLRAADAGQRPAIAALWPSRSAAGFNVVLDMGADIRADADALVGYATMGAAYADAALGIALPRVALLNVGGEPGKGRAEIREAAERLALSAEVGALDARFIGFVEGDEIALDKADVVVTDGFSGNVALKTAEGTARLIGGFLKEAFSGSWTSRLAAIAAYPALKRLKKRMDPRSVNGGVFLGLRGVVVKSHGAADAVAFASALRLAARLARNDIAGRVAAQLARRPSATVDPEEGADAPRVASGAAVTAG